MFYLILGNDNKQKFENQSFDVILTHLLKVCDGKLNAYDFEST